MTLETPTAYGALKVATAAVTLGSAAVFALEPSVQVAIIGSSVVLVGLLSTSILGFLNYKLQKQLLLSQAQLHGTMSKMEINVDGNLKRLIEKADSQGKELAVKSDEASRAAGRREGIESERLTKARED